eukprot:scaffold7730_cov173-Ochromonas_danica.AAC.6
MFSSNFPPPQLSHFSFSAALHLQLSKLCVHEQTLRKGKKLERREITRKRAGRFPQEKRKAGGNEVEWGEVNLGLNNGQANLEREA